MRRPNRPNAARFLSKVTGLVLAWMSVSGAARAGDAVFQVSSRSPAASPLLHTPLPLHVTSAAAQRIRVTMSGGRGTSGVAEPIGGDPLGPGQCPGPFSVKLTNIAFPPPAGTQANAQAGFAEQEIAACQFVIPASHFPIRMGLMEMVFGSPQLTVATTTIWSVMVWSGPPNTGIQVFSFTADDIMAPYIRLGPGQNLAALVQFQVDPGDPDQIIVEAPPDGSNSFTLGWRIDQHNNQTQNPCFTPPPSTSNVFPMTDIGLHNPMFNWLYGINCGPLGCPPNGGWARFSNLSVFCQPSGDWIMQATYTCVNEPAGACCTPTGCIQQTPSACASISGATFIGAGIPCTPNPCVGACCLQDGTCTNGQTASQCQALGGFYKGDGTVCSGVLCDGACCLLDASCQVVVRQTCLNNNGIWQGPGVTCQQANCQIIGACCFNNGSCQDAMTQGACAAAGGSFRAGETCASGACTGACCFATSCLNLTKSNCNLIPGNWQGPFYQCGAGNTCPTGACCLPSGQCIAGSTPLSCAQQGGDFRLNMTCAQANCPVPTGACCLSNGNCLVLTAADCGLIPGSAWAGPNTTCPGACQQGCVVPTGDVNADTLVNGGDVPRFVSAVLNAPPPTSAEISCADFNGNTLLDPGDVPGFVGALLTQP